MGKTPKQINQEFVDALGSSEPGVQQVADLLDHVYDRQGEPGVSAPMLECNSCGSRPVQWGLLSADSKPGDQCPCCFLADYDCDGTLVELLVASPPDYSEEI